MIVCCVCYKWVCEEYLYRLVKMIVKRGQGAVEEESAVGGGGRRRRRKKKTTASCMMMIIIIMMMPSVIDADNNSTK